MKQTRQERAGFSLVEAIFAMAVVGILFLGLYALQASICGRVQIGREDLRATQIMVKKMDQFRLFSWDQILDGKTIPVKFMESFNPEEDWPGRSIMAKKTITYTGTIAITNGPMECSYGPDMKQVTVTVQWTTGAGRSRQRSITTYVAKNGLQNYMY